MFLGNAHIVQSKPEIDTITGACRGSAKVKVRCQNGLKSDALLKKLYSKGCKFTVQTQQKQNDYQPAIKNNKVFTKLEF